jgi:hypothetical protein
MAVQKIAKTVIYGQRPGEQRFQIVVGIGKPYQCGAKPEEWACPVSLKPLHSRLSDIHGNDSFQALCLAIRLTQALLKGFLEDGGTLTNEEGEIFPLEAYGAMPRI